MKMNRVKLPKEKIEEIVERSAGDFRILRNMVLYSGVRKDKEFIIFHILGKFLYNKRIT